MQVFSLISSLFRRLDSIRQRVECLSCAKAGHAIAPLFDVPRWRFEALVRAPVRRPELYRMALTCPSALSAGRRVDESYERLEFLGDAVLSTVIRQKLLRTFPDQDEVPCC